MAGEAAAGARVGGALRARLKSIRKRGIKAMTMPDLEKVPRIGLSDLHNVPGATQRVSPAPDGLLVARGAIAR